MKTPDNKTSNNITLSPDLDSRHEIGIGEEKKQLPSPEDLEKLEAPSSDMFLEDGQKKENAIAEAEEDIKNSPEKREKKEIKNMAEFLEVLEDKIEQSDDEGEKKKLAFHLVKIKGALRQARVSSDKVSLMSLSSEELSEYNRQKHKLMVREDILDDLARNQQFFATIFSEMKLEKDKNIRDAGFQLLTIKKKLSINKEIDKKERQVTARVFDNLGVNTALKLYNFTKPEELADYFLKEEVGKRMEKREKINKAQSIMISMYLSKLFKKGTPELYKKLKAKKYAWRAKVWDLVQKKK